MNAPVTFQGSSNHLFDVLLEKLGMKNDAALCRKLRTTPPNMSKIRNGRALGASMIIKIHEETDMSIAEIKYLAGIKPFVRLP